MRLHPEDNTLMLTVPEGDGISTTQFAMSMANGAWSRYRDLPIYSQGVFEGKLYFGDTDGSVWINDGYVDGVTLAAPSVFTAIQYSGMTSFQNLGSGRKKQVQMIRPLFLGMSTDPSFSVNARYDFDDTELDPASASTGTAGGWDSGVWDTAVWGDDYSPTMAVRGASGLGTHVSVVWTGAATDRTVLVGFDVSYTVGGFL
jgi:hypothetical protein